MWQDLKNTYHAVSATIAATWYGFPSHALTVIGVTGTDGKTTTSHLIHHLLDTAGKKASLISSVYAEIGGKKYDTGFHVTTPDPWMIQKYLRQAVDHGDRFMVLETTSHALDQHRVDGIEFAYGVVTNVTHEHLDYHKSYENYVKTKEKLLHKAKVAVVNRDDDSYIRFDIAKLRRVITYGLEQNADVTPKKFPFTSPLPGEYNRYNCLAAISVIEDLGFSDEVIRQGLKSFGGVKGRLEYVQTGTNFDVIIDFAHTPNAIEKVLQEVKKSTTGKIVHVFGSAAKRDYLKRPVMGEKSALFADYIILTEEDYRDEDVNKIIDEIAQGAFKRGAIEMKADEIDRAVQAKKPIVFRFPDRQAAINFAVVKLAQRGDTVILTGKAHEKSLCRGTKEFFWNEHDSVKKALEKRKKK